MSIVGSQVSSYKIISEIDSGGMGTVYLAEHSRMGIKAAIKALHPSLSLDPSLRNRFFSEAKTIAKLKHPNIIRFLDFIENTTGHYIVMDYAEGMPLDKLITQQTGPIPEERAFTIFKKILNGFKYAHTMGVIHRDIKPSNIIIDKNDEPIIIDFGIVKMVGDAATGTIHTTTGTGRGIGTPCFMSPEQVLNKPVDARSDIFSLGLTLFSMLTGSTAVSNTLSEYEIKHHIVALALPKAASIYPNISAKAQQILDKATEKKPEDRYQSCEEFIQSILINGGSEASISKDEQNELNLSENEQNSKPSVDAIFFFALLALIIFLVVFARG